MDTNLQLAKTVKLHKNTVQRQLEALTLLIIMFFMLYKPHPLLSFYMPLSLTGLYTADYFVMICNLCLEKKTIPGGSCDIAFCFNTMSHYFKDIW